MPPRIDYRYTLANERTFLAAIRTALALVGGGVAVLELLPPLVVPGAREVLGIGLVGLGAALAATSHRRWRRTEAAMRADEEVPASRMFAVLAVGTAVASLLILALLVAARLG